MKKILVLLIAVSMAFALAACASHEETGSENIKAETTNDSGERALAEVDESVEEYEAELFEGDLYLVKYNGASKNIVVPSVYNGKPVYGIDTKCFKDNTTIEKIEFSSGIEWIAGRALMGCSNLKEAILPEDMEEIPDEMFRDCESLINVVMPNNVADAGRATFYGCKSLKTIEFKNATFTKLDMNFAMKSGIETFTVPNSVQEISTFVFMGCENLKEVHIPESVQYIYEGAFNGSENVTVYAPKGSFAETYAAQEHLNFIAE